MLALLLAAGRGTRMKSETPKVLFDINDEPMAFQPLRAVWPLADRIVVIVGYRSELVKAALLARAIEVFGRGPAEQKLSFQTQDPPSGTGDAVRVGLKSVAKELPKWSKICVVNGDLPLIRTATLKKLQDVFIKENLSSACLSFQTSSPEGLGRILYDDRGVFIGVREEKDCTPEERKIREVNGGVYLFERSVLQEGVARLQSNNKQNEFYLTDLLGHKPQNHLKSASVRVKNPWDLMGVNNTYELAVARSVAQMRLQKKWSLDRGVMFRDPGSTFVSARASFEGTCDVGPAVQILGHTSIGSGVRLDGMTRLENSKLGRGAHILWSCVLNDAVVGEDASVGPLAHLRPGTELEEGVKVGNFVELKKTQMKKGSKVSHLSYLGDAEVGANANIGCGTITCNYDGFNKHRTVIGAGAFIGSDTQLVAPVSVGEGAYIGSGTTVTQDVPKDALALSRPEMIIKPGYAAKLLARRKEKK